LTFQMGYIRRKHHKSYEQWERQKNLYPGIIGGQVSIVAAVYSSYISVNRIICFIFTWSHAYILLEHF